mgnify:FL=1
MTYKIETIKTIVVREWVLRLSEEEAKFLRTIVGHIGGGVARGGGMTPIRKLINELALATVTDGRATQSPFLSPVDLRDM